MAKPKKTPRPKAQTPKGFRDYFGAEVTRRKEMLDTIARIYHLYGFDALETSAVETVEALGKFLPDVDRPNEGVFAWQEDEKDWLALRYDLTAPLARVAAQYRDDLPSPYRRYAMGPVWRNEKPGPGRFRQFYQCDADTVGAPSVAADAEICMMLADALEAVGIARGDYKIRINSRKILNDILKLAGVIDDDRVCGIVLRAIDKIDRLGVAGVKALLERGRRDESGDFTEGAGLGPEAVDMIMRFVNARDDLEQKLVSSARIGNFVNESPRAALRALRGESSYDKKEALKDAELLNGYWIDHFCKIMGLDPVYQTGINDIVGILSLCQKQGYNADRIQIDPTLVRGLGYYTGPIFEAVLTFPTLDEKGVPRQFGSVAGGGRYDDLVKRFTGQEVPATGVSIGVDRLLAALAERGKATKAQGELVVVTVMDRDRMADYQGMVAELRKADIRAEVYLGNPKNFGNQLKYADKRNAAFAVIQGGDELARDVVQIKDLHLGAKLAETVTHEEWKDQPAQFECPRADLVGEIIKRLGRA